MTVNTYCETARPMYFDGPDTVEWLLANDRGLLVDIIANNETHLAVCGS